MSKGRKSVVAAGRGVAAMILALQPFAVFAQASANPQSPTTEPGSVEFIAIRSVMQAGEKVGDVASGLFCTNARQFNVTENYNKVAGPQAAKAFKDESAAANLRVFQPEVSAFGAESRQDPDFRLAGTVLEVKWIDICVVSNTNVKGTIRLKIKWEVFSTREQRVVFAKTNAGEYQGGSGDPVTSGDIQTKAFAAAFRDLFADAEYRKATSAARAPAGATVPAVDKLLFRPAAKIQGGTQGNVEALRASVVTVESGTGSGSGFFVDASGYLITNRHVVGSARFVKIKLASGKDLVGEVIRDNAPNDVALVKTETPGVPGMFVSLSDPVVGEDVFAIGSPRGAQFAGTFTRGVLSGTRQEGDFRFLQSDVAVNPGNSGGPLLDSTGAVIGITTAKARNAEGMAFFIPIKVAFDKLSLGFE